ncbi:MAG: polyprenyl synthetase family protein [Syntrophobacterales bacterium]|nr:MAG: polyprenyl synthetase family protein [Syntrophobacterales bacterium]
MDPGGEVDIDKYLTGKKRVIDAALGKIIPKETDFPQSLHRAIRYTLFPGGKRIRPILAMAAYEVVGGKGNGILPYACGLELIHTYSLIHDDLPALDNDNYRRGKPTTHRVFGEAMAILAGDALLTEAFHLMGREGLEGEADPRAVIEVIGEISRAVGLAGMIAGQVVDIESEGKKVELPILEFIHTHKTGSLILVSVRTGGRLGGARDVEMEALTRYGKAIGLAFQITDDILDVKGSRDSMGRPPGVDMARDKITYPALLGVEESKRRCDELIGQAIAALELFGNRGKHLREIANYIGKRNF